MASLKPEADALAEYDIEDRFVFNTEISFCQGPGLHFASAAPVSASCFLEVVSDKAVSHRGRTPLTFGTRVLMSSNFLRPPNNQLSSFEDNLIPRKWLRQ